jgi:hypothetical protein
MRIKHFRSCSGARQGRGGYHSGGDAERGLDWRPSTESTRPYSAPLMTGSRVITGSDWCARIKARAMCCPSHNRRRRHVLRGNPSTFACASSETNPAVISASPISRILKWQERPHCHFRDAMGRSGKNSHP